MVLIEDELMVQHWAWVRREHGVQTIEGFGASFRSCDERVVWREGW